MKKLLLSLAILGCASLSFASDKVSYSSFTATNDTGLIRSVTSTNTIVQVLSSVIVSSVSASGTLKIYNSTYTTSGLVAVINLGTQGIYDFKDTQLKGIYYVTTLNTQGVTIIYKY